MCDCQSISQITDRCFRDFLDVVIPVGAEIFDDKASRDLIHAGCYNDLRHSLMNPQRDCTMVIAGEFAYVSHTHCIGIKLQGSFIIALHFLFCRFINRQEANRIVCPVCIYSDSFSDLS